jgi:peptidoglycan hydrolase-like protein with peptidoglycan-binding domain
MAGGMSVFAGVAQAQDQDHSAHTVREAQRTLQSDGYYKGAIDGVDGPMTMKAIREYQRANNLHVNGQLDRQTRDSLGLMHNEANREQNNNAVNQNSGMNNNAAGQTSYAAVSAAQRALQRQGFYKGSVNGNLNPETVAAIREYQRNSNLTVNGRLDQQTLSSLGVSK